MISVSLHGIFAGLLSLAGVILGALLLAGSLLYLLYRRMRGRPASTSLPAAIAVGSGSFLLLSAFFGVCIETNLVREVFRVDSTHGGEWHDRWAPVWTAVDAGLSLLAAMLYKKGRNRHQTELRD